MLTSLKDQLFVLRHKKDLSDLHQVMAVYTFVFLIWGIYRLLFPVNVWVEETVLKFLVFGVPVFFVVLRKEKGRLDDLGMTTKGLIVSLYFGLLFGIWLAVFGNIISFLSSGNLGFNPDLTVADFEKLMILGLFTAFWEQLLFAGYMLPRIIKDLKNETAGIVLTSFLFSILHVPVQLVTGATPEQVIIRFLLLFTLMFGNSILYLRFKNLAAPIFAHLSWGAVIYLFG